MTSLISVIIPCFNQGIFLEEAISSLNIHKYTNLFEVIVVNDGSTDAITLTKLSELSSRGIQILNQDNLGLAAARNAGVQHSKCKYVLPLDCDNKIVPEIFIEAAKLMEQNAGIDMVYTDAYYFGQREGEWVVGPFDGKKLLFDNYVDACTLIRKSTLLELGMYETEMPFMGHEDWELWVNFYLNNKHIVYLPKKGFYYRVRQDSMSVTSSNPNRDKNKLYIYLKHPDLIAKKIYSLEYDIDILNKKIKSFEHYIKNRKVKAILKIILGRQIVN